MNIDTLDFSDKLCCISCANSAIDSSAKLIIFDSSYIDLNMDFEVLANQSDSFIGPDLRKNSDPDAQTQCSLGLESFLDKLNFEYRYDSQINKFPKTSLEIKYGLEHKKKDNLDLLRQFKQQTRLGFIDFNAEDFLADSKHNNKLFNQLTKDLYRDIDTKFHRMANLAKKTEPKMTNFIKDLRTSKSTKYGAKGMAKVLLKKKNKKLWERLNNSNDSCRISNWSRKIVKQRICSVSTEGSLGSI